MDAQQAIAIVLRETANFIIDARAFDGQVRANLNQQASAGVHMLVVLTRAAGGSVSYSDAWEAVTRLADMRGARVRDAAQALTEEARALTGAIS